MLLLALLPPKIRAAHLLQHCELRRHGMAADAQAHERVAVGCAAVVAVPLLRPIGAAAGRLPQRVQQLLQKHGCCRASVAAHAAVGAVCMALCRSSSSIGQLVSERLQLGLQLLNRLLRGW